MAETVRSRLSLDVDVNTRSAFRRMATEIKTAENAAEQLEKDIRTIGQSEIKLTQITNQEVRKRVNAWRQETSAIQRRNAAATRGSVTSRFTGGGGGGLFGGLSGLAGAGSGLVSRALPILSAGAAAINTIPQLADESTRGRGFGSLLGAGFGGLVGSFAGPAGTAAGIAAGTALGGSVGNLFDKGGDDAARKHEEAAEKQKQAAQEMEDAAKQMKAEIQGLAANLPTALTSGVESLISTLFDQQFQRIRDPSAGDSFNSGTFESLEKAFLDFIAAQEAEKEVKEDFIEAVDKFVESGLGTEEQAREFLIASGITPTKPAPDPLMDTNWDRVYGRGGQI